MKKKFYDCSINILSNQLHNRESLGPIENDMMKDLGVYSNLFGWERIFDYKKADLIVTNGFYTDDIINWSINHSIPKIKRMDGIYWKNDLKYKNELYNLAANISEHVIFISNYSCESLYNLYGFLPKKYDVILNNVDDNFYYPIKHNNDNFVMVSSATNWSREEKRLNTLIDFSKIIDKNDIIKIIGRCDVELPNNIVKCGYIENPNEMNNIISTSDLFLSFFFRDAGSKVTCQSVKCQIPILYSNTGGLREIVNGNGIDVDDYQKIDFLDDVPELNVLDLHNKYNHIKKYYNDYVDNYIIRESYRDTLSKYFKIFNLYV